MKNLLVGVIVTLLGVITYLAWFAPQKIPKGKVLVSQAYLDSLGEIARKPPKVVIEYDTIWRDTTYQGENEPPKPSDQGQEYTYKDSIISPEVNIWLWDRISKEGIFLGRKWAYRLNVPYLITKEITLFQPVPMPYQSEPISKYRPPPDGDNRYYAQIGYNFYQGGIVGGGGVIRKNWILGAEAGKKQLEVKVGLIF